MLSSHDIRRGGDRTWGGDLIVFNGPGVKHLTDLVLPGEGISEIFDCRLKRRDCDRTYVSRFHASRMRLNPGSDIPPKYLRHSRRYCLRYFSDI